MDTEYLPVHQEHLFCVTSLSDPWNTSLIMLFVLYILYIFKWLTVVFACLPLMYVCEFLCSAETPLTFDSSKDHSAPLEDLHMEGSLPHTDSGIGEEQVASILNGSDLDHSAAGQDAMSELLSTLSSEVKKSQESLSESPSVEVLKQPSSIISISQPKKGINVKEILKSLVASPVDSMEAGLEPVSYPDHAAKAQAQAILPMQFHSFDRWGVIGWYVVQKTHVVVI